MEGARANGVNRRLVAVGALVQAVGVGLVGFVVGMGNPWLAFLGIPGGFGVGLVTRPNGPALRQGLYVAGLGLPLAVVLTSAYGFVLSLSMGLGLDSVVSFGLTIRAAGLAAIVGPFHAITGAVAADRANVIRVWVADGSLSRR